ncbi:MAG: hypothetical protein ABJN26_13130 [Stappiaceae bacterium]
MANLKRVFVSHLPFLCLLLVAGPFLAVTSTSSFAAPVCSTLDTIACANSEACMLDLPDEAGSYQCREAVNRCEIGYRQHLSLEQSNQDNAAGRCEARQGCAFQRPGQCYCPQIEGIACVCGGGKPHLCVNDLAAAPVPPTAEFTVVDLRQAADVTSSPQLSPVADAIGQVIRLSPTGIEADDMGCDAWEVKPVDLIPRSGGPDVRDVFIGPVAVTNSDGDKRILQSWAFTCEGTDTIELTQIDPQVVILHLNNSSVHAIAERTLDATTIKRMQKALADVKFYDGPIDGILNEATISGAAFWAEYRMDPDFRLRYARPALTRNLFDTMGVFE